MIRQTFPIHGSLAIVQPCIVAVLSGIPFGILTAPARNFTLQQTQSKHPGRPIACRPLSVCVGSLGYFVAFSPFAALPQNQHKRCRNSSGIVRFGSGIVHPCNATMICSVLGWFKPFRGYSSRFAVSLSPVPIRLRRNRFAYAAAGESCRALRGHVSECGPLVVSAGRYWVAIQLGDI